MLSWRNLHCNYEDHTLQFQWQGSTVNLTPISRVDLIGAFNQLTSVVPMLMEEIAGS